MRQTEVVSQVYSIDQRYGSMQGPSGVQDVLLTAERQPELLWLTGFSATIVAPDGDGELSQEFMCHNNLDLNYGLRSRFLDTAIEPAKESKVTGSRIATISQGYRAVKLPQGFGIPIPSIQPVFLTSQVLNHNLMGDALDPPLQVRHRMRLEYLRDRELDETMKPLFAASVGVLVSLEEDSAYLDTLEPSEVQSGSACAPGEAAMEGARHLLTDELGQAFTAHWIVPPGRQVRRTLVTGMLNLTYDTTIHYIAVHVHPFAESLSLRDLTTGEDVFTSRIKGTPGRIGLASVDSFSSAEGIAIYAGHEYELTSVYNNTSAENADAMAVMNLFLADRTFDRDRALRSLASLDQEIAAMDEETYQRWLSMVRRAAVPSLAFGMAAPSPADAADSGAD